MERLWEILKNVTSEVFETMFYLFIEPQDDEDIYNLRSQWQGPGVLAQVTLQGPQTFTLGLALPVELCRLMAKNFLGLHEDEVSQESLVDVLKESSNMIAGLLVSHLNNSSAYQLQIPQGQLINLDATINLKAAGKVLWDIDGHPMEMFIVAG